MLIGIIFLSWAPLFWVLYPNDDGWIATIVFSILGVAAITVDLLF